MVNSTPADEVEYLRGLLREGAVELLAEAAEIVDGFPHGRDPHYGNHWLIHAIDCGCIESIRWILMQSVDLSVNDAGFTPLLSALDRPAIDRYQVLQMLIDAGAPIDQHGFNDWTALHAAAAKQDVAALELLIKNGADPTVRTRIDDCATPLEEALTLGCNEAAAFLRRVAEQSA